MNPNQSSSGNDEPTATSKVETIETSVNAKPETRAEDVKSTAKAAVNDLKSEARDRAHAAKDSVAEEVSSVASALRTAANELRSGSPQERTLGQIADGLADASDAIREKDLGEIVHNVSDFARHNPAVFLGASALLGFAATRFAKASGAGQTALNASSSNPASTGTVASGAARLLAMGAPRPAAIRQIAHHRVAMGDSSNAPVPNLASTGTAASGTASGGDPGDRT